MDISIRTATAERPYRDRSASGERAAFAGLAVAVISAAVAVSTVVGAVLVAVSS